MTRVYDKTLIDYLVRDLSIPLPLARQSAQEILAVIEEGLTRDGVVNVTHFGTFRLKPVSARVGYNPNTRERITIPAHHRVVFTPAKALRDQAEPPRQPSVPLQMQDADTPNVAADLSVAPAGTTQGRRPDLIDVRNAQPPMAAPQQAPDGEVSRISAADSPQTPAMRPVQAQPPIIAADDGAQAPVAAPRVQSAPVIINPQVRALQKENDVRASTKSHYFVGIAAILLLGLYVSFKLGETGPDTLIARQTAVADASTVQGAAAGPAPNFIQAVGADGAAQAVDVAADQPTSAPTSQASHDYFEEQRLEIARGDNLWLLADKHYRDAYLWPHIYQANATSIDNPDYLVERETIIVPGLEGPPDSLSEQDRRNIAKGYYLAYLFYKNAGRADAGLALQVAKRYDADVVENYR